MLALGVLLVGAAPAAADDGAVFGTLRDGQTVFGGVTIVVEKDGAEVARATSSATGSFRIMLAPGTYTAKVDAATLPEGLRIRRGEQVVEVADGGQTVALFLLGADNAGIASRADRAPQLIVGGLQFGLVLAMAAIGLSLIFGTTGLTNFAHGELVTGGAILGYVFNVGVGLNLIPATVIAVVVGALAGGLLDLLLWRPLRRRGTGLIAQLVVSIGLSLVLRYVYLLTFDGATRSYKQYAVQSPVDVGPVGILPRDFVIMGVSVLVLVGVALALQRTKFGKATRAISDNPALAASSGIDVERVINVVWIVGSGLAVLGGVFLALSQQVGWQLGQNALLLLFAGITLGGLGTAYGALVGSVVIGVFTQISTLWISPELQTTAALVVLILILVVRPQGILGSKERVG